jgi:ribonuclease HI
VPDRDPALAEVVGQELLLLQPGVRATSKTVESLLHPDFREFGASGDVWDRASIVAALAANPGEAVDTRDLDARLVADGVALVTYRATSRGRVTLRSSLWVRDEARWRCFHHQGTVVE